MQYILTEEEYKDLTVAAVSGISNQIKTINELCRRVANSEPVDWRWPDFPKMEPGHVGTKDHPIPWGCIKDKDDWHCDECPVKEICTFPDKDFSQ